MSLRPGWRQTSYSLVVMNLSRTPFVETLFGRKLWTISDMIHSLPPCVCLQCENKETFIQQIQSLDIETQADIAGCIQQVRPRSSSAQDLKAVFTVRRLSGGSGAILLSIQPSSVRAACHFSSNLSKTAGCHRRINQALPCPPLHLRLSPSSCSSCSLLSLPIKRECQIQTL